MRFGVRIHGLKSIFCQGSRLREHFFVHSSKSIFKSQYVLYTFTMRKRLSLSLSLSFSLSLLLSLSLSLSPPPLSLSLPLFAPPPNPMGWRVTFLSLCRRLKSTTCVLRSATRQRSGQYAALTSEERNLKQFRGGLVFKAHIVLYHPTLGSRVIKKKKKFGIRDSGSYSADGKGFRV